MKGFGKSMIGVISSENTGNNRQTARKDKLFKYIAVKRRGEIGL